MTIARHLARLHVLIETIAEHNSVRDSAGLSLEDTLSALTPTGRDRVAMLLEKVRAFSNDPDERTQQILSGNWPSGRGPIEPLDETRRTRSFTGSPQVWPEGKDLACEPRVRGQRHPPAVSRV